MKQKFTQEKYVIEAVGNLILNHLTDDINCEMTNRVMDDDTIEFTSNINLPRGYKLTAYFYQDKELVEKTEDLSDLCWEASHFTLE